MKKVAVTGASGMIGRWIIQELIEQGCRIRALVRRDAGGENDVEYIRGDITSVYDIHTLLQGVDTIFHCAAELYDDELMERVNVTATRNLASIAADAGVSCLVHISSAGVVGSSREAWIDETTPCMPTNAYEKSKYKAELELTNLDFKGMRVCVLRPTNVIDIQRPGVLSMACCNNWKDRLSVFIKGGEVVHLIHAKDVANAAVYLANDSQGVSGTYLVACDEDERNTLSAVIAMCRKLTGKENYWLARYHLPVWVPYWLRCFRRGKSLHGNSRFSSKKLIATGFRYPLGLDGAVSGVCIEQKSY